MLDAFASKAPRAGFTVRGNITSDLCDKAGIRACVPLGCPSLTINLEMNLGSLLKSQWIQARQRSTSPGMRIAIHLPQLERGGKFHEEVYGILLRLFDEFDGVFVLQSSYDYPGLQKRLQQLGKAWNASRIWFFGNMPDWMNALSEVDFVIGCRIHGTMAAIAAGKAAWILPTDFRTLEMAQAMKLPMIFGSELDRLNPKPSRGRTCMGPERAWLEKICG